MGAATKSLSAAALAVVLLVAAGCGGASGGAPRSPLPVGLRVPALDGGVIDLAEQRGRAVVLHCFSTGSVPAQVDVDQLRAAQAAWPRRLQVIGIAFDPDGYALVAPWRRALDVTYLIGLATPALADADGPLGRIAQVPTTILLDARGVEVARRERQLVPGELARLLTGLLGPPAD